MPRISHNRPPAVPTTAEQRERVVRILEAAEKHGAAKGLEHMQMVDVAKDAGVAIATLYRYFPSKTALFVGLMRHRIDELGTERLTTPGGEPWEAVSTLLVISAQGLLDRPLLARAMLTSNNMSVVDRSGGPNQAPFHALILREAEINDPTPGQERLLRLAEQTYYGILTSALNGHIEVDEAQQDIELACQLLLADLPDA